MQHSMDIDFFSIEEEKVVFRNPGNLPICLTGVISKHMIISESSLDKRHESGLPNSLPESNEDDDEESEENENENVAREKEKKIL